MGDRCHVSLYVLEKDAKRTEKMLNKKVGGWNTDDSNSDGTLHYYGFEECNYGNIQCYDDLERLKIPYEANADGGSEYGAFTRVMYLTPDGKPVEKEWQDGEESTIPLAFVKDAANISLQAVKDLVAAHEKSFFRSTWKEQDEIVERLGLRK